jgi:polyisoprenoid-binding protein YceI
VSTETVSQQIPAGTWVVDPVHSTIHFAITHSEVATFRSGFKEYEATLTGGENPRLTGSVEVAGIDIEEEQLKGHLLSPEFFDVAKHPRLVFSSTELSVDDEGQVRLAGELEIHGQTHEVSAVGRFARVPAYLDGRERIGLSVETGVDRRKFGLSWNADLPGGGKALEYDVAINVELEFVAAEGE